MKYTDPSIVKTFQIIKDMNDEGYLGNNILSTTFEMEKSVYAEGKCAMRWDGSWFVSVVYDTPIYDKTVSIPFPYFDEKYKNEGQGGCSDLLMISTLNKSDEEIAASVKLVKYLTSSEYFAGCNEVASDLFPARFTPTANTPKNPLMEQTQKIFNESTSLKDDIQTYDVQSNMLDTVRSAIQGIIMGNTAEEAVQQIVDNIQENEN